MCRKRILIGYENYVRDDNVFPVSKFMERFDYASRSIGYGKSAMIFHMLRTRIGDDLFYHAIRQFVQDYTFRIASWADLQKAFEMASGQDLDDYFRQWVHDVGIPDLELADVKVESNGNGYEVRFAVRQKGVFYRLSVPVAFYFPGGRRTERLDVRGETNPFVFFFDERPKAIVLDEYYDVFRKLTVSETPPTIERLITAEKSIIVSSPSNMDLYSGFTKIFENQGAALTFLNQRSDVTRKFSRSGLRKGTLEPGMKEVKGDQAEDPPKSNTKWTANLY